MYANRVEKIKPFRVMEVLHKAGELAAAGHEVVHFEVGEPDFNTAAPIVEAGIAALRDGHTKYTSATGIEPLRHAIAHYYDQRGVAVDPGRVIVTSGASGGLTLLAALLLNPDDELLITDPGYPCNEVFAALVGARPKQMAIGASQQFRVASTDITSAWGPQTKGALLASPANPTGVMMPANDLRDIAQAISQRDGFLILDEIYQGICHDSEYQTGLKVVPDLFVLNSFSKFFGMTGWRLGWLVVPQDAVSSVTKLAQNLFIAPNTPAQYAALAAFEPDAMVIHKERAQKFEKRGRQLASGLTNLGFDVPVLPDGAFYLYVDVSHTGLSGQDFCWRLLDEYHVAVTPGEDFGAHQAERFVRFAYTTSEQAIELGLQRIATALSRWQAE